ncbi:MAG TPA: Mur ligase family protein [Candidatus Binatia bacterium]|nr:Mur ligase family protein [Candidatus Binatia bacterium]
MKKVFFCGIAGTGMSALAGLFKKKGYRVCGSDARFYPPVDGLLKKMAVRLFEGLNAKNIPADTDFCVIGNVVGRGNPEVEFILDRGLEYYSMAEALQRFFIKGRESIVVSGSHGKTTTASFIAHMLTVAGLQPGFFIGGKPLNFSANYGLGRGAHFVLEGDEYETAFFDRTAKFFKYRPDRLIITALEHDHIDFYPDAALYLKSFRDLVNQVPGRGTIIVNRDYEMARQAVERAFTPVIFYGRQGSDFEISAVAVRDGGMDFSLQNGPRHWKFHAPLPGPYNVWNLTAGIILGLELRLPLAAIEKALATFQGVERRLCVIGRRQNTVFIEDFAHHPTAIANVLQALPSLYPGHRVQVVFEPRSWSLRRNFFQEQLPPSLAWADEILIKDVFQKDKIPAAERLDVERIKAELEAKGRSVSVFEEFGEIQRVIESSDLSLPRVVILLSNGDVREFTDWAGALTGKKPGT